MPKYMDTAADANVVAKELMALIKGPMGEVEYAKVAEMIARLVNLGVRCSPRGVQHTVRLNAVRRAVQDLPVLVSMKEVKDERTGRTYNALITKPLGVGAEGIVTVEGATDEE